MNKARRKKLDAILEEIETIKDLLEEVKYEEQEAVDNMPESLQGSERYEAMVEAISSLEEALENLGYAADNIEEAIE